uniref:SUZ domain-containing protein n=1 Tax=Tetraodon nigroviridis TaxID=99883 RepID=H3C4U2_TETNG
MLVHRVAAYFGMEHNVDQTGKSVIINRTSPPTFRLEQRFLDLVHKDPTEEISHWKSILKRDGSLDEQPRLHPSREKQNKSVEEREEEYKRARERIFSQEVKGEQERHNISRAEEYNPYAETQRRRQLFRGSRDSSGSSWTGSSRQSSTEVDCRYGNDPRPWSSTDSDSSYQWSGPAPKARPAANHSWDARGAGASGPTTRAGVDAAGGRRCGRLGILARPINKKAVGSSRRENPTLRSSHPRLPSACPLPSSPAVDEPPPSSSYIMENGIPPGSILINPHTGKPFLNPDGTPAVYNPPDTQQPMRSQAPLHAPSSQPQLDLLSSNPQIEELSAQFAHLPSYCQPSPQGGVSVSYPQSKVVTQVGGEGGYCCVVAPPS